MKSETEMDANRIERELEDTIKERDRVRQLLNDESQLRRQSQDTMREMDAALTRETKRAKDAEQRARELEYANRDLVKERDLLASDCELVRSELAAVMAERDELVKQGQVSLERLRAFKVPEPADTIESVASAIYEEALADGCTHGRTAEYFADVLRKEIEDETGPRLQWATWRCRDRIVALVTRLRAEPKPVWKCDSCGFECFGGHTDHCTNDPYCCPVHHVRPDGSCNRKDSACIASEEPCSSDASCGDAERKASMHGLGRERYLAEIERLAAERDRLRADFEAAAGELLIPVPEPGTDIARLMIANRMCVRMHDRLHSDNKRLRRHKRKLQAKLAKERDLVKKTLEALGECYGAAFERRTAKELEHRILRAWQSVYPDQPGGVAACDQKASNERRMRVELHRRIVAGRDEIITKRTAERDRMREALERIGTECLMYCGRTCVEAQPTKPCPGCIARVAIGNKR